MSGNQVEQRLSTRKIEELPESVAQLKVRFQGLTETTMKAVIVDISNMGIGIAMPEPLSPGQEVKLLGVDSSLGIPAQGTVMWNMCDGATCRAGLMFDRKMTD
jgi:hypothetical protein